MKIIRLFFILLTIITIGGADSINIDELVEKAKKSNKHVFVFLHKPHCGFCDNMIRHTLPDENIESKIKKNFIFVDIDIADKGEVIFDEFKGTKQEFAKSLGFDFYPSSVFIDEEKEVVFGQAGYKKADDFSKTLRYVKSRAYEDIGLDEYK